MAAPENSNWTFGCELEHLLVIRTEGTAPEIPPLFRGHPGEPVEAPPVDAPASMGQYLIESIPLALQRVCDKLAPALDPTPGTVVSIPGSPDADHLQPYMSWCVKSEILGVPIDLRSELPDHRIQGIEITSPVLLAGNPNSFENIRKVCQSVQRDIWVQTPSCCGLHIHVGQGANWMPIQHLRRIAGLLYAADPLLAQLHPVHRHGNIYCVSNRLHCFLTRGLNAGEVEEKYYWHDASVPAEIAPSTSTPVWPAMPPGEPAGFTRRIARGELDPSEHDRAGSFNPYNLPESILLSFPRLRPLQGDASLRDTLDAVSELLKCTNRLTVAELMKVSFTRPAYNFNHFGEDNPFKRTIEFRQPAGTDDPDEVVAHARICVRLCEWAGSVELDEYWSVIEKCAQGERDGSYDVFDLLIDLGLADEARVMQETLEKRM